MTKLNTGDRVLVSPDYFHPFVATVVETAYLGPKFSYFDPDPDDRSPYIVVQRAGVNDFEGWKYPAMTSVVEVPLRYVCPLFDDLNEGGE